VTAGAGDERRLPQGSLLAHVIVSCRRVRSRWRQ
jgi:hypothetical protein